MAGAIRFFTGFMRDIDSPAAQTEKKRSHLERSSMTDFLYLALGLGFFGICWGFVALSSKLMEQNP